MRYYMLITSTLMLSACNGTVEKELSSPTPSASTICSGTTILNVAGTADCSGSGGSSSGTDLIASTICSGTTIWDIAGTAECSGAGELSSSTESIAMLSFVSRKDNASFPVTAPEFAAFFAAPDRVVASLKDEQEKNSTFTENHSIIPGPLNDSDGAYSPCPNFSHVPCDPLDAPKYPRRRHFLETIAKNDPDITSRELIDVCGSSGTIEARVADCASKNGLWAFYDGKKYGQEGEGDWKLVSVSKVDKDVCTWDWSNWPPVCVTTTVEVTFEVWRDERTKLLWSDKSENQYNWYKAAGYSKPSAQSLNEAYFVSHPGSSWQPANPLSVCPDVVGGEIAAGGGTPTYVYENPETSFKAGLFYPQVTWRLPSRSDWYLAEVNGIRKVLPNMSDGPDRYFWSSTTYSENRRDVWWFGGATGIAGTKERSAPEFVRCVASSHD